LAVAAGKLLENAGTLKRLDYGCLSGVNAA